MKNNLKIKLSIFKFVLDLTTGKLPIISAGLEGESGQGFSFFYDRVSRNYSAVVVGNTKQWVVSVPMADLSQTAKTFDINFNEVKCK